MRPDKHIEKSTKIIRKLMQGHLEEISISIIDQVMTNYRKLKPSRKLNASKKVKPKGQNRYKSDLKAALSVVAFEALGQARKEVPKASSIKLMENEERLLLGEYEKLPPAIRARIDYQNSLLVGTQIADIEKTIYFQLGSSLAKELTEVQLEMELLDAAGKLISGNATQAAASVSSATVINESRNAFFTDSEVEKEIEAFEFKNDSPQVAICVNLNGKIFPKDDPNKFNFTPPLHFNCRSWIKPLLKLPKGAKIERLSPPKTARESIQFGEKIKENCGCGITKTLHIEKQV